MAHVTIKHFDHFHHSKSGVTFHPTRVKNEDGSTIIRGTATVPDKVAREHFAKHHGFIVVFDKPAKEPKEPKTGAAGSGSKEPPKTGTATLEPGEGDEDEETGK